METTDQLFAESRDLIAKGRWRDALQKLAILAEHPGCPPAALLQLAELELFSGAVAQARTRLAAMNAADPEVIFLYAQADSLDGNHPAALERIGELRRMLTDVTVPLLLVEARVLLALKRAARAREVLEQIVERDPRQLNAYLSLLSLLVVAGESERAMEVLTSAQASHPASAALCEFAGTFALQRGDQALAEASFIAATKHDPNYASSWLRLGYLLAGEWRFDEAAVALAEASRLLPGDAAVESMYAYVLQELGDSAGAADAYRRAGAMDSDDPRIAAGAALMLPQIPESRSELEECRSRFADGLHRLTEILPRFLAEPEKVWSLYRTNFLLAYQGEDDLALQSEYSHWLAALTRAAAPQFALPMVAKFNGKSRLKVGFVSSHLRTCTAGLYFERWITGLNAQVFERYVYDLGVIRDATNERVRSRCEHFTVLQGSPLAMAEKITSDALDVLVYPEVGMDCTIYLLATMRLAPVQCAGWGHPVTTGSAAIDYFFSCSAMEPDNAREHYREQLLLLPGIGVDYPLPVVEGSANPAQFGLPTGKHLYFCPQSLFKIHPDMDDLLARLLAADKEAVLVMFQGASAAITSAFGRRLQECLIKRGVAPRGQLKFLPRLPTPAFRSALTLASAVLDTLHWSGGNTSLDAFAAGVPVITLPGAFMRGRQSAGMLELMKIPELVATSSETYLDAALRLGNDFQWRESISVRIAENRDRLFDRHEVIDAFGELLLRVASGSCNPAGKDKAGTSPALKK